MIDKAIVPQVGTIAPEFHVETAAGKVPLHQFAAQHKKLVLTTQDSYRFHPN